MGRIYYLFGKSASGKDSIYNQLIRDTSLNLKRVVLYTTRPIRTGEEEGVEYHFTNEEGVAALEEAGRIIEMRAYHTVYGIWKYLMVSDDGLDLEQNDYLMAGTLESFANTRAYFGSDRVIPFYIYVEDGERLSRALRRERKQEHPKYAELCRRFLSDEQDFCEENLKKEGITTRYENVDMHECIGEIAEAIRQYRKEDPACRNFKI